jgi:hypothetical protein
MFFKEKYQGSTDIYAFIEKPIPALGGDLVEFEQELDRYEFFDDIKETYLKLNLALENKAELMKTDTRYVSIDELADDEIFSIEDSFAAGNCEPGTRDFIEKHKLLAAGQEKITLGELRKRDDFEKLLKTIEFKRIFAARVEERNVVIENAERMKEINDVAENTEPKRERKQRVRKTEEPE